MLEHYSGVYGLSDNLHDLKRLRTKILGNYIIFDGNG